MTTPVEASVRRDEIPYSQPSVDARINGQVNPIPFENSIRQGFVKVIRPSNGLPSSKINGNKIEYTWTQDPGTKYAHNESSVYVSGSFMKTDGTTALETADWAKFYVPSNFGYMLFENYTRDVNEKRLYSIEKNFTETKTIEAVLQTRERAMRNSCLMKPIGDMLYTTGGKLTIPAIGQIALKVNHDVANDVDSAAHLKATLDATNAAINTAFNAVTTLPVGTMLNEEARLDTFMTKSAIDNEQSFFLKFRDLDIDIPAFPNNIRKHGLSYTIKDRIEMPVRGSATDKIVFVVNKTSLYVKNYVLTETKAISDASAKLSAQNDNIAFVDYQVVETDIVEDIIALKNVKQVQHAGLIQFASRANSKTGVNGVYLNNNPGQTYIFNQNIMTDLAPDATNVITRSDRLLAKTLVAVPPTSVQMKIGPYTYPADAIPIYKGASIDFAQLYDEYVKVVGDEPALSFDIFKRTFPFVVMCPWSSSGVPTKYGSTDISFSLPGYSAGANTGNCNKCLAFCGRMRYFIITPNEDLREVEL